MLLSQWWELEETAIRCELGMWGRKWQAKKKKKRQKKALPMFLPFFFFVLVYSLICSPAVHHFTSQLWRREPYTLTPQAHLRVSQGILWSGVLGGWAVSGRRQRGLVEAACCESPCTSLHCAESHGQAAASLPRFAWSRYLHFSLLLVIYISQGLMP